MVPFGGEYPLALCFGEISKIENLDIFSITLAVLNNYEKLISHN